MTPFLPRAGTKRLSLILLAIAAALLINCKANNESTRKSTDSKSITEIQIVEEDGAWNCIVIGSNPLVFSAVNHLSPNGVILYFPDTSLVAPASVAVAPDNELIQSIQAEEFIDGAIKNSRISIHLKINRPYALSPVANGVKISFPKTLAESENGQIASYPDKVSVAGTGSLVPTPVNLLKTVSATPMRDSLIVNLKAERTIEDYKSFAIENPARIVFDIFQIQTPDTNGQTIAVDSQWVNRILYTPYPDRIRLVLDLPQRFLSNYFSFPTATGLLIYIGRLPEPLRKGS